MTASIENLLKNPNLPGPRGNLELMYSFAHSANAMEISECMSYLRDDLRNSPEEFVVMCGLVGYAVLNTQNLSGCLAFLRRFASHGSWRIREAVAMGIQETGAGNMDLLILHLKSWLDGNELEKRAVVAGLCEPRLLIDKDNVNEVLQILWDITLGFSASPGKISDAAKTLRQALGYGWSVAIVHHPIAGKKIFEQLAGMDNPHIRHIVKENLKKNRLLKMDKAWVEARIAGL
ncbi:MAG TPA: hypothetical protein PLH09_11365 [Lentimicrobium sp.]|nr:hypothetical protein [Lentimicrobium sp.]